MQLSPQHAGSNGPEGRDPTTHYSLVIIPGPAKVTFVKWVLIIILSKTNYVHAELLQPSELPNWLCGGFRSL